jgi:chitin synthase
MVAAFRISNWDSFCFNIVPILIFIVICFVAKNEVQIFVAQILAAAYCLLMMAVFVGQAIQMTEDGLGSPSAIFFISLTGSFIVAGLLHPQEIGCLAPLLLYFLSIPCMYLLLIIYSIINLNVVTWGTREVQTKKTKKELEEEKKATEELKKKNLLGFLNMGDNKKEEGSITFNLANLFKCMFCTYPKPNEEALHLIKIQDQLDSINQKLTSLERGIDPNAHSKRTSIGRTARFSDNLSTVTENEEEEEFGSETSEMNLDEKESDTKHDRDDLLNPYWIEDKDLKNGEVAYLHPSEIQFWRDLIDKYLYPIEQNKEHQARVAFELKELRNRMVFAFFMLNALFVLVVFLLQLNKEILHVDWPLGVRENITVNPDTNEYIVDKEFLELEPIGLVFVIFFGTILVIQFIGMLFHRFGTLSHILGKILKKRICISFESKSVCLN